MRRMHASMSGKQCFEGAARVSWCSARALYRRGSVLLDSFKYAKPQSFFALEGWLAPQLRAAALGEGELNN